MADGKQCSSYANMKDITAYTQIRTCVMKFLSNWKNSYRHLQIWWCQNFVSWQNFNTWNIFHANLLFFPSCNVITPSYTHVHHLWSIPVPIFKVVTVYHQTTCTYIKAPSYFVKFDLDTIFSFKYKCISFHTFSIKLRYFSFKFIHTLYGSCINFVRKSEKRMQTVKASYRSCFIF